MAWQDRVRPAAYTPAGGGRFTFKYEDVALGFTLRGTSFEFPDADGTYVQRTGTSGRRYPLRVIFTGNDHDLEATRFETALRSPGVGLLEHPMYGAVDVIPLGDVSRRDDLVTGANQTIFEVTFWSTIGAVYPTNQEDPGSSVLSALLDFNTQAAEEFNDTTDLGGTREQTGILSIFTGLQASVAGGLKEVAAATEEVQRQFFDIDDSITQSIDVLIGDPVTLASQTVLMIEVPARSAAAIADKLSAYADLANAVIRGEDAVVSPGFDSTPSNTFHTADLYVSTYVAGAVLSTVNTEFETRPGALQAAEIILSLMDEVTQWRDDNYAALGEIDTGGQYQQLQEAVAIAAGFLVEISFSLKQERSVTLATARTPVDLCAELYGQVDEVLDFFSESNNLSWQEHLEISRGRRIVYYI